MKRIKGLFVVALMAIVSLALVGCDDGGKQEGITFSSWSIGEEGSKNVLEGMVKDFNDDADAADKVTPLVWTWGDTVSQFAIRYKGTEQFDVAQIDIRMLAPLAEAGYLADVKDLFGSDYLNANFDKASLEVGQFDGVQYGIPWTLAPMGMVYNPEILKASGVTDAQITSMNTYAGFKDVLTTVKNNHPYNKDADKTNDILPFAAMSKDAGTVAPDLMPWLWANDGSVFSNGDVTKPTMSSQANKEVISYFKELADEDLIQAAMDRGTARNLFKQERTAFFYDALLCKGAIAIDGKDIEDYAKPMPLPTKDASDTPYALSWGHLFVIVERSPKKETSVEFIKHMISEEQALEYFDKSGLLPSTKSVLANEKVSGDYWSKVWTPFLSQGKLSETAVGSKEGAYNKAISDAFIKIFEGSKVDDVVAEMDKKLKEA